MQRVLKHDGGVKLYEKLIDQLVLCSSACCNVTMTSKITMPVPVDDGFFSINVQKSRIEQNMFTTFYHNSDAGASLILNKALPLSRRSTPIAQIILKY